MLMRVFGRCHAQMLWLKVGMIKSNAFFLHFFLGGGIVTTVKFLVTI